MEKERREETERLRLEAKAAALDAEALAQTVAALEGALIVPAAEGAAAAAEPDDGKRRALVERAFAVLDTRRSGVVSARELQQRE